MKSFREQVAEVVQTYCSNISWTKGPTQFTIPAIDYLVMCGVAREDAEGNENEILDQLNGEVEERFQSQLTKMTFSKGPYKVKVEFPVAGGFKLKLK